jgi:hypothetical protein
MKTFYEGLSADYTDYADFQKSKVRPRGFDREDWPATDTHSSAHLLLSESV